MRLEKVAIVGAGAIGSYFIAGLSEKLGENLWIVAEGERSARLSQYGILVNGIEIPLHVKTPDCLPMIEKIVDEHTIVMSPLNGVDSEKIIGSRIGMEHMVYSLMKIASQRIGNHIAYDPDVTLGLFFGEPGGEKSERVLAIQELLEDTDVHYKISHDIQLDIWLKYALNISKNLPQAIINCGYGAYVESGHLSYISKCLRDEVVQVAAAKGIDISDSKNPAAGNTAISPDSRFSTLQDLDAKRPTEIEMFSGTLIRMGKELGVKTPFNEFAYHAIKCLEEKNCGKIR